MLTTGAAVLAAAFVVGAPQPGDIAAAARAYSAGQAAELRREFEVAAQSYELAHEVSPNPAALRSACRTRLLGGQKARAANHALEIQESFPNAQAEVAFAAQVLRRVQGDVARIAVTCASACTIVVDRRAVRTSPRHRHTLFVEPGERSIAAALDGNVVLQTVNASRGEPIELTFRPAPEPPPAVPMAVDSDASSRGLSPWFLAGAAAVSAGLIGASTWAVLDANDASDAYARDPALVSPSDVSDRGTRARVLVVASGVALAGTIALAALGIDWSSDSDVSVGLPIEGPGLVIGGRFK